MPNAAERLELPIAGMSYANRLAWDGEVRGLLAVADAVKPSPKEAVERLLPAGLAMAFPSVSVVLNALRLRRFRAAAPAAPRS